MAHVTDTNKSASAPSAAVSTGSSYTPRRNNDAVELAVQQIWSQLPGVGIKHLMVEVPKLLQPEEREACDKNRVKAAKDAIPYARRLPDLPGADDDAVVASGTVTFVRRKLEERQNLRVLRRFEDADVIGRGLEAMGILIDDHLKTWQVGPKPPEIDGKTSSSPESALQEGVPCDGCGRFFGSRNLVFRHLRDVSSGCGNSIWKNGQAVAIAPSAEKKIAKKVLAKESRYRSRKTGATATHADKSSCLWMGDLPLVWTRAGGGYKSLRALLFAHRPRDVPQPWLKTVVRKGYRPRGKGPSTCKDASSGDDSSCRTQQQGGSDYLGYAIVVFRDAEEAKNVLTAMDGMTISAQTTFRSDEIHSQNAALVNAPQFRLKVRPVEKSDNIAAATAENLNQFLPSDTNGSNNTAVSKPGIDPPLLEQLRPLGIKELLWRIERMNTPAQTERNNLEQHEMQEGLEANTNAPPENSQSDGQGNHDEVLALAVSAYHNAGIEKRREETLQGRLVPLDIRQKLLRLLETLRWPAKNERQGLSAERYLVLQSNVANDMFYSDLREACAELMEWAGPGFYYSGIAVTKNFVASPHIDHRDRSYQYAISLGNFTSGGELCVEGGSGGVDEEGEEEWVNVVTTHNRIAQLDGRNVHWVRSWEGGDRYSLIFYDTSDRCPMPVNKKGAFDESNSCEA